jgi:hypothetical protein
MIINITPQDIWNEFVRYRKTGQTDIAFKHLRRYSQTVEWEVMVASIAHNKYKIKIGDTIRVDGTKLEIVWDNFFDQIFGTVPEWDTPRKRIHSV